jgi:hypothetical protein
MANKGRFEDEPGSEPAEEVSNGTGGDEVIEEPVDAPREVPECADGNEVIMM